MGKTGVKNQSITGQLQCFKIEHLTTTFKDNWLLVLISLFFRKIETYIAKIFFEKTRDSIIGKPREKN